VQVDFEKGNASLRVSSLDVEDYHDVVNALLDGPSVEAEVSYEINWSGITNRFELHDAVNTFAGKYENTSATIKWAALRDDGLTFVSDPASTSFTEFALLGRERNGVFFS
jgi:hypothetical protein